MHIFNLSFDTGTVPKQWLNAIVTPVPKVAKPDSVTEYGPSSVKPSVTEYGPISVTPLLYGLAEKLTVRRWLYPAILLGMFDDQFGFRPPVSTTCALVRLLHHVTIRLKRCSVSCDKTLKLTECRNIALLWLISVDLFCKMANPRHCVNSLQFLLLNLVTTTSDPTDIGLCTPRMWLWDV